MQLSLTRYIFGDTYTIGELFVDGVKFCDTLEDKARQDGPKVQGETAIPTGTYSVIIDKSERFGRLMPHILDVQGFEGIRIHSGNTDKDTAGCVLVGVYTGHTDLIVQSSMMFKKLFALLKVTLDKGEEVLLTVSE